MSSIQMDVDSVLEYLLRGRKELHERGAPLEQVLDIKIPEAYMVARVVMSIFRAEPLCLQVNNDVVIVGDIHGQYDDLMAIFKQEGFPPDTRYLFLGDYVDRGVLSLEAIMLVFLLKIKHPEHIFLLRGNHETKAISSLYGFRDDIKKRFGNDHLWRKYCDTFTEMPICAIVGKKLFACHGGLAPSFLTERVNPGLDSFVDYINNRQRPYIVVQGTELFDVLWSDPQEKELNNKQINFITTPPNRGCTVLFTERSVKAFLKKFELRKIIRAHQAVTQGFKKFASEKLFTLFSAPGYCGCQRNKGAIMKAAITPREDGKYTVALNIIVLQIMEQQYATKDLWHKPWEFSSNKDRHSIKVLRREVENTGKKRGDFLPLQIHHRA